MVTNDWLVNELRLTAFTHQADIDFGDVDKIKNLIGEEPDNCTHQPKIKTYEESADYKKGLLIFREIPGRIDWHYASKMGALAEIPNVGTFSEALDEFSPLMLKWLETCPALTRIALAPKILLPVKSHQKAYEKLQTFLSDVKLDPESSEFAYSINRKRFSKTEGLDQLLINRLSKWRAIKIVFKVGETNTDESYTCSLEIDINSHQENKSPLSPDCLKKLFEEFVELAKEISIKGDIK